MKRFKHPLFSCVFLWLLHIAAYGQSYEYKQTISLQHAPGRLTSTNSTSLYITQNASHQVIQINTADGSIVQQFGQKGNAGNAINQLDTPVDVALSETNQIYIADKGNQRIIKYNHDGSFMWKHNLSPQVPESITVGPDGKLYICYSGDGKGLLIFNETTLESTITTLSSDKFRDPVKVRFDANKKLYIVDRNTGLIKVSGFNNNTATVSSIIKKQNGSNLIVKLEDFACTSQGSLIISSSQDKASENLYQGLYRFKQEDGSFVDRIGLTGANSTNEGFDTPIGIYKDSNDNLYIADSGNKRIQVWEAQDDTPPEITHFSIYNHTTNSVSLNYKLNEKGSLSGLVLLSNQPPPSLADITSPAPDALVFTSNYATTETIGQQTVSGLSEGQNYRLYYITKDAASNTSTIHQSDIFSTAANINYILSDDKKDEQVTLNINSTLAGTLHYIVEEVITDEPTYLTHQQIATAGDVQLFEYAQGGYDQQFEIDDLKADSPYRISFYIENTTGTQTPVKHYIFRSHCDLDLIYNRYFEWATENTSVDYANPLIMARYDAIVKEANKAINNLSLYPSSTSEGSYDLVDNADDISHLRKLIEKTLFPLVLSYHLSGPSQAPNPHYQDAEVRQNITGLYAYMHKRGFTNGCKSVFKGGGVYLGLTGYFYASMLMKEELEKAGLLQTVSENMKWWTRDELINLSAQPWNKEQRAAIKQADQVRTFYNNRLLALITAPDSDLKTAEEMLLLTDVYNEACNISHGWGGFIKPDFTGYHHHGIWGGHYNTGAALVSAMMSMHTRQTAYSFSSDAINNLSQVMLANRFYCNKYDYALG
jgi:sugar lactone lactonase YvrE